MNVSISTSDGRGTVLATEVIERLGAGLRGAILTPKSTGYDEARTIWNAMIDRRPGLIVRCASADDVVQVVRFARVAAPSVSRTAWQSSAGMTAPPVKGLT